MCTDFTYMHWVLSSTARTQIDYKTRLCSFAAAATGMVYETKLFNAIPLPVVFRSFRSESSSLDQEIKIDL